MDLTIDYNERMLNRYPEVIKAIREFQVLIKTQSLEVEAMHEELTKLLSNAYISTADEAKITQWEEYLGIAPSEQGEDDLETWLSGRKDTILARLYNVEKLNEKAISDIVKIFTGGTAVSYFKNGTVHVIIYPSEKNKIYKFENVERELSKKMPAHLGFRVSRNYYSWLELKEKYGTWGQVYSKFEDWEAVLYINPEDTNVDIININGDMTVDEVFDLTPGTYTLLNPIQATVNSRINGVEGTYELELSGTITTVDSHTSTERIIKTTTTSYTYDLYTNKLVAVYNL